MQKRCFSSVYFPFAENICSHSEDRKSTIFCRFDWFDWWHTFLASMCCVNAVSIHSKLLYLFRFLFVCSYRRLYTVLKSSRREDFPYAFFLRRKTSSFLWVNFFLFVNPVCGLQKDGIRLTAKLK